MKKDAQLNLRVRRKQLEKIKELGFKYSDCWDIGYERILENEYESLVKLREKYHKMYIHVNTKIENYGKKSESEKAELGRLKVWYLKQNRSIENPTQLDINTLTFQLKKRDISTFTVEQVFEQWRSEERVNE